MREIEFESDFPLRVRQIQIIVAALAFSVVTFLGVVLFLVHSANVRFPDLPTHITGIFFLIAAIQVSIRSLVVSKIVNAGSKAALEGRDTNFSGARGQRLVDTSKWTVGDRLLSVYHNKTIVGSALIEGPAFLLVIAYLLQPHWVYLAGIDVLLVGLVVQIPTQSSVEEWISRQMRILDERSSW